MSPPHGSGVQAGELQERGERQRPGGRRPGGSALTTSARGSTVTVGPRRQTDGEGSQAGSMPDTASREQEASAQSSWERCRPPGNPDLTALEPGRPSRTPGCAWRPHRAQLPGRSPAEDRGPGGLDPGSQVSRPSRGETVQVEAAGMGSGVSGRQEVALENIQVLLENRENASRLHASPGAAL